MSAHLLAGECLLACFGCAIWEIKWPQPEQHFQANKGWQRGRQADTFGCYRGRQVTRAATPNQQKCGRKGAGGSWIREPGAGSGSGEEKLKFSCKQKGDAENGVDRRLWALACSYLQTLSYERRHPVYTLVTCERARAQQLHGRGAPSRPKGFLADNLAGETH